MIANPTGQLAEEPVWEEGQWYWEYFVEIDQWYFHAPCYTPEVSLKVGRPQGHVIVAFHKDTTMPQGVKEILVKMLPHMDLYTQVDLGITKILVPQAEVKKAAGNVAILREILKKKGIPEAVPASN